MISIIILFLILLIRVTDGFSSPHRYPYAKTIYGSIRGIVKYSNEGTPYYSFTKVPYAMPPIGKYRFKGPKHLEPWEHVVDCQEEPPMCIQKNYWGSKNPPVEGQEDCLYLNVYTPKMPTTQSSKQKTENLLPVMVFIHGGGFFSGWSSSLHYGPDYFMDHQDVVVVTFNFRVGVMGFLSTADDNCPGNMGLKDQVAVLKWIKHNIEEFSGNKNLVTLFGQSSGSACVHFHLLSPLSKNLFHRAISQSGSALNLWAKPNSVMQRYYARETAMIVGCADMDTSTEEFLECLKHKDAVELVDSVKKLKVFDVEPIFIFGPALEERTVLNPRPFIARDPAVKIKDNEFSNIPWMVGVVEGEGIIRAAGLLRDEAVRTEMNANFDQILPPLLGLPYSIAQHEAEKIWKDMKKFYWGGANRIDVENPVHVKGFIDLMSDRGIVFGVYQAVLLHAAHSHKPIYFYNFAYQGAYTHADLFATTAERNEISWGTCHSDELLYLFRSPALFPDLPSNSSDVTMKNIMTKLWTNFAKYGNPTPNSHIRDIIWDHMEDLSLETTFLQGQHLKYLNISGTHMPIKKDDIELQNTNCFNVERMKFLENLELTEAVVS